MGDVATVDLEALKAELTNCAGAKNVYHHYSRVEFEFADNDGEGIVKESGALFLGLETWMSPEAKEVLLIIARHLAGDAARTEEGG